MSTKSLKKIIFVNIVLSILLLIFLDIYVSPLILKQNITTKLLVSHKLSFNEDTAVDLSSDKLNRKVLIQGSNKNICFKNQTKWCATLSKNRYRITDENIQDKKDVIIFFGGSCIFGHGLNDNQTLPYLVQQKNPNVKVYNFGLSGGAPHHMLELLLSGSIDNLIKDKNVLFVYGYIQDHLLRVSHGFSECCAGFGPRFVITNNQLRYKGQLKNIYPSEIPKYVYGMFNTPRVLLSPFAIDHKIKYLFREKNLLYKILAEIKKRANLISNAKFAGFNFYVSDHYLFSKRIQEIGYDYLNTKNIFKSFKKDKLYIPSDGHPSFIFNQQISHMIDNEIKTGKFKF